MGRVEGRGMYLSALHRTRVGNSGIISTNPSDAERAWGAPQVHREGVSGADVGNEVSSRCIYKGFTIRIDTAKRVRGV